MSFRPTHVVPPAGLRTWGRPDPGAPNGPPIVAGLPVQALDRRGEWVEVLCSNGWRAWVDGRELGAPAAAGTPPAATEAGTARSGVPHIRTAWLTSAVGAAVVVSTFLPWLSVGGASITAWKVPLAFLVDREAQGAPWLAWALLVLGGALVLAALRPVSPRVTLVLAAAVAVVAVVYIVQLTQMEGASLGDAGVGAWLALIAGVTGVAAPVLVARRAPTPASSITAAAAVPVVTPAPMVPVAPVAVPVAAAPVAAAALAAAALADEAPPPSADTEPTATPAWVATHRAPATGIACFGGPDPATGLGVRLDPWLEVRVAERRADWAHVVCSNGWTAWVDGRRLDPLVEGSPS